MKLKVRLMDCEGEPEAFEFPESTMVETAVLSIAWKSVKAQTVDLVALWSF